MGWGNREKRWLALFAVLFVGAGIGAFFLFSPGALYGPGWIVNLEQLAGLKTSRMLTPAPQTGYLAPDFVLDTIDGKSIRLIDLRGKAVILNFWATWCVPCKQEMPLIETKFKQNSDELEVLAVDFGEPVEDVRSFVKQLGLTFDILLDPQASVQEEYAVRGFPTTFVIDKDGIIRAVHLGEMSSSELDRYLARAGVK
jgi:peroxiredoxin